MLLQNAKVVPAVTDGRIGDAVARPRSVGDDPPAELVVERAANPIVTQRRDVERARAARRELRAHVPHERAPDARARSRWIDVEAFDLRVVLWRCRREAHEPDEVARDERRPAVREAPADPRDALVTIVAIQGGIRKHTAIGVAPARDHDVSDAGSVVVGGGAYGEAHGEISYLLDVQPGFIYGAACKEDRTKSLGRLALENGFRADR